MGVTPVPIILDTDIGDDIDDLYALCLALFHPRLRLLAVTTVHGDTQAKARLAAKALRLAGRADIPVAAGIPVSAERLARGQTAPDPVAGATHLHYVESSDLEWNRTYPDAAELIREVVRDASAPVALVGIGPFSNLAQAVAGTTVGIHDRIRCLALMGGQTESVMSEHNVLGDPEAADRVLNCGLPVFLGTYGVTRQVQMTQDQAEALWTGGRSRLFEMLLVCTRMWGRHRGQKPGPVLYDLVPLFWLADPQCVETRASAIRVELAGQYTRGQTVRQPPTDAGTVLESVSLDAAALLRGFVDLMTAADAALGGPGNMER